MNLSGDDFSTGRRQSLQGLCALAALTIAPAQLWAKVQRADAEHFPASGIKLLSEACDSVIRAPTRRAPSMPGFRNSWRWPCSTGWKGRKDSPRC